MLDKAQAALADYDAMREELAPRSATAPPAGPRDAPDQPHRQLPDRPGRGARRGRRGRPDRRRAPGDDADRRRAGPGAGRPGRDLQRHAGQGAGRPGQLQRDARAACTTASAAWSARSATLAGQVASSSQQLSASASQTGTRDGRGRHGGGLRWRRVPSSRPDSSTPPAARPKRPSRWPSKAHEVAGAACG